MHHLPNERFVGCVAPEESHAFFSTGLVVVRRGCSTLLPPR